MRFPCLTILSLARERIHVVLCLPTFSVRQPRWNIAPIEWHPSGSKPNHRSNRPTVSQRCVYVFVSNVEQTNRVWGSKITVVKSRHLFRNAATMNIPIELDEGSIRYWQRVEDRCGKYDENFEVNRCNTTKFSQEIQRFVFTWMCFSFFKIQVSFFNRR